MEDKQVNILTKDGQKDLLDELKKLVEVERPQVIEDIKDARNQGDLSENAEFDAARERQGQIEDRIKEIEAILENSKIASSTKKVDKVRIGSKVIVENLTTKKERTYIIVGSLEVNPLEGKISNVSPMGSALINKKVGEVAEYRTENGDKEKTFELKVKKIQNA